MKNNYSKKSGFTLIEVAVALAIVAWVMGSAIFLVSQYADERNHMRESFLSNQVAWNQLMEEYRHVYGLSLTTGNPPEEKGQSYQGYQQWQWQTDIEPSLGQDLYRYQVSVAQAMNAQQQDEMNLIPALSIYLVSPSERR